MVAGNRWAYLKPTFSLGLLLSGTGVEMDSARKTILVVDDDPGVLDYASNVALYPKFQEYFRSNHPPMLAVWGKHDPFFLPPGAEAFKRDNPSAEVHFFDTGHFALETHAQEIALAIRDFLGRKLTKIAA